MKKSFAEEYDKLRDALYDFIPDDEPWFFPAVGELIEAYDKSIIIEFAQNDHWPEYTFELLVKSGLREIDKEVLLPYLNTHSDDNLYCTAFCLSACGYQEGFDILTQFADKSHKLSKHFHPPTDILPDLDFINDKRVEPIKDICKKYP